MSFESMDDGTDQAMAIRQPYQPDLVGVWIMNMHLDGEGVGIQNRMSIVLTKALPASITNNRISSISHVVPTMHQVYAHQGPGPLRQSTPCCQSLRREYRCLHIAR